MFTQLLKIIYSVLLNGGKLRNFHIEFGDFDNPDYRIEKKSYKAVPAATVYDDTRGFMITATNQNGRLCGAAICGTAAHEMIHQLLICAKYKITLKDLQNNILTLHPVLSELL